MSDALCGPVNALQSLQKHTSVDRTLQQDRLDARRSPAESFRSSPGPNVGVLDAEFEAFQASHPLELGYPEPPSFHHAPPASSFRPSFQQPDWASDFQNMHLDENSASPFVSDQLHQHVHMQRSPPTGWHQDFLHQQKQPMEKLMQQHRPTFKTNFQGPTASQYMGTPAFHPNEMLATESAGKQKEKETNVIAEDEAFTRAFDNAQLQQAELINQEAYQYDPEILAQIKGDVKQKREWAGEGDRIVQQGIDAQRTADESRPKDEVHNDPNNADELARTAGALLDKVKGDTSKKFQKSNFMSLMRQLRDREVVVNGDKIVDTQQPLHPGGTDYPHDPNSSQNHDPDDTGTSYENVVAFQ